MSSSAVNHADTSAELSLANRRWDDWLAAAEREGRRCRERWNVVTTVPLKRDVAVIVRAVS